MLTDAHKVIIIVLSPIIFFALIIALGVLIHRRVNQTPSPTLPNPDSDNDEETQHEIPAQDPTHGHIPGLGPNIALPQYEDKVIHVRRLSAYPEMDEIRRVSSVTSTLGDGIAQLHERQRRGSGTSTLVVTDMGDGHVGVERRVSVPDIEIISRNKPTRAGTAASPPSSSNERDPGSPRDDRFSMHLSYSVPPTSIDPIEPDQPTETLTTPLPHMLPMTSPLPPLSALRSAIKYPPAAKCDRSANVVNLPLVPPEPISTASSLAPLRSISPTKKKFRPDSIALAIARSATIVSVMAAHHILPPPPPTSTVLQTTASIESKIEPQHTEPGEIFKGWEGFSPSPQTASLTPGLLGQVDGRLPVRRSSLDSVPDVKVVDFGKRKSEEVVKEKKAEGKLEDLTSPSSYLTAPVSTQ